MPARQERPSENVTSGSTAISSDQIEAVRPPIVDKGHYPPSRASN